MEDSQHKTAEELTLTPAAPPTISTSGTDKSNANASDTITSALSAGDGKVDMTSIKTDFALAQQRAMTTNDSDNITITPTNHSRGRGRGGRVRGKSRASKGRKRKRNDGDEDEDELSDDSEVYTTTATTTKSGRAVQKPTTFVPPTAASPSAAAPAIKKKPRVWRKNAENAVCKLCLRGVSPASNMIVFCDGCNTPYHQWCHHPPIHQSVIDESDKEWYCRHCRRERTIPVAEADIAHFVAAPGVPLAEKQKFFSSLTSGALVTLLTRATTLVPDLPVFEPSFALKYAGKLSQVKPSIPQQIPQQSTTYTNGESTIYAQHDDEDDEDEGYGPEEHPTHYVRPGKGLMSTLPPDKDDEERLVDEENSKGVFDHIYLIDQVAANDNIKATTSRENSTAA